MAENGRFDPMLLESLLHYPETLGNTPLVVRREANAVEEDLCMKITEAGATGTSSSDLSQSPEHGDGTGTQVGEEHGPDTLTQLIGNGRTILDQEQEGEGPVLNHPGKGSKKRRTWSGAETDLLMTAVASEKTKTKSRLDNERFWEGVAKAVAGRTGTECRRRVETLKKSYNAVSKYCDKEKKEFADLNGAELRKMELATWINGSWYKQIRDHCPPRPAKQSRAQGPGSCSRSDGATASGRPRMSQSSAASALLHST